MDPSIAPTPPMAPSSTSGCSTWNMLWGNITGDYSDCIAANQALIQQVPNNAATYYGADSTAAQVAQKMATAQQALVPGDVFNTVASYQALPAPSFLGVQWWVWAILGGGAALLVLKK